MRRDNIIIMRSQRKSTTANDDDEKRRKRTSSCSKPPLFPERRMINPNGILLAPPVLLLHNLRYSGNFRSAPLLRRVGVRHRDNERCPDITDKPCCYCFCTRTGENINLLLLLLLLLRMWQRRRRHWPATEEAKRPTATRA